MRNVFPNIATARVAFRAAWAMFVLAPPMLKPVYKSAMKLLWTDTVPSNASKDEAFKQWAHSLPGFTAYWSSQADAVVKALEEKP